MQYIDFSKMAHAFSSFEYLILQCIDHVFDFRPLQCVLKYVK